MVTIDDIRAAATRIRAFAVRTPLLPALWADGDRPLWIKPENLQPIGAFKVRGAFNAIGNLDESVRTRGVVAYSSGNHAQAVAYAAAVYGIPAHLVMPRETPALKVEATRRHGAEVVLCGPGERERVAAEVQEQTGGVLIPPFDHPDIIAGQGTIGLEIAEDLPVGRECARPGQRWWPGFRDRCGHQGAVPTGTSVRRGTRAGRRHRRGTRAGASR